MTEAEQLLIDILDLISDFAENENLSVDERLDGLREISFDTNAHETTLEQIDIEDD